MRYAGIDVMDDMGRSNAVVKEIENRSIGPVNSLEGSLGPIPIRKRKVRDFSIGVLKPCVANQPAIYD